MEDSNRRYNDIPSLVLLGTFLGIVSIYLQTTKWSDNLELVTLLAVGGFLFGVIVGKSSFDQLSGFWLIVVYSLFIIPLAIGLTLETSIRIVDTLIYEVQQTGYSIHEFASGGEVTSPILFLSLLTIVFWIIGVFGGFNYVRKGIFIYSVLLGFILLVLIDFLLPATERNHIITGLATFIALLLIIRTNSIRIKRDWRESKPTLGNIKDWSLSPGLLIIGLAIVIVAWSVPVAVRAASPGTPESERFSRFSYKFRDNFERFSASLRGSSHSSAIGYGPSLKLGDQISISEEVVFIAEASTVLSPSTRIYWRGSVYEKYENGTWQEGEQKQTPIYPNRRNLSPTENSDGALVTYRIKAIQPLGDYFLPGELISINNPGFLVYSPFGGGGKDIISVEPESTILPGNGYRPEIWIKNISEDQLSTKMDREPDWVLNRYLQLPTAISPEIKALAEEITSGLETQYEKTNAITEYLRNNYIYSDTVKIPVNVKDRIEWFLFDSKTGFCNYYATAEVLLLRSIGIPSRLAVGFSQGEVTNSGRSYTIKRKNSHAWPEVYFPETGWVVFEPTSSLPNQSFIRENKTGSIIQEETILSVKPVPESNVLESATNSDKDLPENENAIRVGIDTNRKNIYIPLGFLLGVTIVFGSTAYYLSRHEKSRTKILLWILYRYKNAGINPPVWFDEILSKNQRSKIESIFRDTIKIGEFARVLYKRRGTPSEKIQELIDAYPVVKDEGEIILKEYQRYIFGGISADENLAKNAFLKLRAEVLKTYFRKHLGLLYRRKRGT
jgi:transglutaminase-like putative cysteine protease